MLISCKKSLNTNYSIWYVDSNKYVTSNVVTNFDRTEVHVLCYDRPHYFAFNFPMGGFTDGQSFKLTGGLINFGLCAAAFIQDTTVYLPAPNSSTKFVTNIINNKAVWVIDSTVCINRYYPFDTVIINGIFREQ